VPLITVIIGDRDVIDLLMLNEKARVIWERLYMSI
jgi:hypothetical protein